MNRFASLDDKNLRVLSKLKKVEGDNPYAIECRKISSVEDYHKMISHLREQIVVAPETIKKILGEGAFDALLSLEEAMPYGGGCTTVNL